MSEEKRELPVDEQMGPRAGRHADGLRDRPWDRRAPALRRMFEEISSDYDRLNTVLSVGLDRRWRAWTARAVDALPAGPVLDLASGTGALVPPLVRRLRRPVVRLDLSPALLRYAATGLGADSPGVAGEMDRLPFRDASFAAVVQGFALRHSRDHDLLFREIHRVLRPDGLLALLDMRVPEGGGAPAAYRFYFRRVLPHLAALLGGDRAAYEMMVASVEALPPERLFLSALAGAGFVDPQSRRGLLGAVRLLVARRPR